MSQVLERQQDWLVTWMLAIPAHRCMHTVAPWRQRQCGLSARPCGFWLISWGCPVFAESHAKMDTLAALGWSICSTGAGGSSHVQSSAPLVAQHQNPAKMRTVLAPLSHGYLPYSVASVPKLMETSRGLGTRGPAASRHRRQQRARGGKYGTCSDTVSGHKVLETLV